MDRPWVVLAAAIAGALTIGAVTPAAAEPAITGIATFQDDATGLPPGAVFEAALQEISRADAPAVQIAGTRIENPGPPPIAFAIPYDPSAIDERLTYGVRARIRDGERLLYTSDTVNRVLTRGAPSEVTVAMRRVAAAATDAAATGPVIGGMFVYMADAARLNDCRGGRSLPVAMEGDFPSLERAYLAARPAPGQSVMVTFEGTVEERPRRDGDGTEPTVVVGRFIRAWPGETCERNRADASLSNTYWRIVNLGGEELRTSEGRKEPHIILRVNEKRFAATVGCDQMAGSYETDGPSLRFGQAAMTMMACPPPLDRLERLLANTLAQTAGWRIYGQFLELFDADGKPLAVLQAVYLD